MKALLIDTLASDYAFLASENIEVWRPRPIEDSFSESEFSFDSYCHNFMIEGKIKEANPSVVIIPYSITDNILEFTGLQLAHHIRLTESLGDGRFVPIVFIGSESPYTVSRLTPFANILYCEGSYWSAPKREPLQKLISANRNLDGLQPINYEDFLKRIDVRAPSNYESHHGVDNEFCLLNWSKYVGCDDVVSSLDNSIGANLYFKFIKSENPFAPEIDPKQFLINASGTVLVIDDEGSKGWYAFYRKLFKVGNVNLECLEIPFKDLKREEIISAALERVADMDPDIVLLDLRLCDEDFDSKGRDDELTGLLILDEIKKWNRGAQVIITSASDKGWNYRKALRRGAAEYVLKTWRIEPRSQVVKIRDLVESLLPRGRFLKTIWNSSENQIDHLDQQRRAKYLDRDLEKLLSSYLLWAYDSLSSTESDVSLDNAFHFYFLILEACAKVVIDEENPIEVKPDIFQFQFRKETRYLRYFNEKTGRITEKEFSSGKRRIPYNQKFLNLIHYVTGSAEISKNIVELRNEVIHPDVITKRKVERVKESHVKEVFSVVEKLIQGL